MTNFNEKIHEDIISLAKNLISIKSIEGNTSELHEVLSVATQDLKDYSREDFCVEDVPSALIYNTPTRPSKFRLLFNIHLDVIPGPDDEYVPRVHEGRLYGVGAMDMKANAATVITLFRDIAHTLPYPIALQLVTDEEVGGFKGTYHQVTKEEVRADMVIATEPTNFDIVYRAKGVHWSRVFAKGVTAHSAYPWRGDNAIKKITDLINEIYKVFPNPTCDVWKTTVNVSSIKSSNQVFNKIPADAEAAFDIRFCAEDKNKIDSFFKKIKQSGDMDYKLEANEPAMNSDKNSPELQLLARLLKENGVTSVFRGANGTSDARHFSAYSNKTIEFGPIGGNIGAPGEWVDINSLGVYYRTLFGFMKNSLVCDENLR